MRSAHLDFCDGGCGFFDKRNHRAQVLVARRRVAELAQKFIEERCREAVRIEDLCRVRSFDTKTLTRLVPEAGLEPARAYAQGILSPLRFILVMWPQGDGEIYPLRLEVVSRVPSSPFLADRGWRQARL